MKFIALIEPGMLEDTSIPNTIIPEAFQKSLQAKRLRGPRDLAFLSGLAVQRHLSPVGLPFGRTRASLAGQKEVRR